MAILAEADLDGRNVTFHSFTGDEADARRVLDTGAMVSLSGIVTFAKADPVRRTALLVPDDRLLIETDAPFLSPKPVRKKASAAPASVDPDVVAAIGAAIKQHRARQRS